MKVFIYGGKCVELGWLGGFVVFCSIIVVFFYNLLFLLIFIGGYLLVLLNVLFVVLSVEIVFINGNYLFFL